MCYARLISAPARMRHIVNFRIEQVALSDDLDYFLALPHWLDALAPPTKECLAQLVESVRSLMDLPPKALPPASPDDSTALHAVAVAPRVKTAAATVSEWSEIPAAPDQAALRRQRRTLARALTEAALREAESVGFRAVDDFQLLEPLIRVLARAGDGPGALRAAAETGGGFKDFALGMIAETQVRDGDPAGARRTAAGCQEGSDALCRMARAMAETGDADGALRTVRDIPSTEFQSFDPRAGALSEIAEAQAKAGDVNGALHTIASISVGSPNRLQQKEARRCREGALAHIAEAQAQAGDLDGSARTLAAIEDAKVRLRVQNKVLVARARGGDLAGALTAAGEGRSDKKDWVLGCIAEAQAQAGDLDGAARTVAAIEEDYRREQAMAALAVARARAGDFPAAFGMVKEIPNTHVRKKAQARLALAQAEAAGDPASAMNFVKALPTPRDRMKMHVAFASLLLDDPAQTRWWMDFSSHHLWE